MLGLAIEANGAALQALADACVEDISDGDAAVATAALDVARRFAARFPPSSSLLDAALQRASTFLESSDDLAEAALRAAAEACVAASKTPEHAAIAADRVRAVAALGERIVNDGNAPSLIDACADCCRAALIAARNAPSSSQASVTACAFVALLLDDSRDVELCARASGRKALVRCLLRTLPLDDHDACVQACRQPAQALEKLCAPPRDLALAMDVAQAAHCLAILGKERCGVEAIACAARAQRARRRSELARVGPRGQGVGGVAAVGRPTSLRRLCQTGPQQHSEAPSRGCHPWFHQFGRRRA